MGMTMTQKILAAHAGLDHVVAGQLIEANLDVVLANDITAPVAINEFEKCGADAVFDNTRIALVLDHFTPNKDIKAAEQCLQTRINTTLRISLTWDRWALSMRFCRKRALSAPATA